MLEDEADVGDGWFGVGVGEGKALERSRCMAVDEGKIPASPYRRKEGFVELLRDFRAFRGREGAGGEGLVEGWPNH
jgi:hypothetical protein